MFRRVIVLSFSAWSLGAFGQEENLGELFKVDYDTPLTIDLDEEDEKEEDVAPKEKKKRNFYFGVKTKKHFTRTGSWGEGVYELFNYLKVYEGPPEYARDFYWYDPKKKKIVNSLRVDPKRALVLHGPYVKKKGEQVIEEGWFYKGMKHKRWVRFNGSDILMDKKYWWKGWPQDALLAYYDHDRRKLREVVPVHHQEKQGEYWAFHENGNLAARGFYTHDYKTGTWREYYVNKKLKREVLYPEDPFDFEHQPVILREWDRNGKLIYDREDYLKEIN